MDPIVLGIIIITTVVTMVGFQNLNFFDKYKFSVGAVQRGEYYRLLTAGFLHADWMHLIFNMLTLYFFADIAIYGFGYVGFLIIYFASMILGNIFTLFIYKKAPYYSAIGASGGVSGILFAAIAMSPFIPIYIMFIPIPIPGYIFGLLYFSYSVYSMLNPRSGDNIGHSAHLGGALFGLVYAVIAYPQQAMSHILQIGIMSLPLIYLGYEIFVKKRIG